jgi:4-carboxymuconolactone decarboxylase
MTVSDDERWQRGLKVCDEVYGPNISAGMTGMEGRPHVAETVHHLFGDIWSRPALTIAQKRLLVIGATTMLGRADLIEVQVGGALRNGELTDEQLDDMLLLMLFYAGAGNTGALMRGIDAAKKAAKQTMKT